METSFRGRHRGTAQQVHLPIGELWRSVINAHQPRTANEQTRAARAPVTGSLPETPRVFARLLALLRSNVGVTDMAFSGRSVRLGSGRRRGFRSVRCRFGNTLLARSHGVEPNNRFGYTGANRHLGCDYCGVYLVGGIL
jgi:hypothetical protein